MAESKNDGGSPRAGDLVDRATVRQGLRHAPRRQRPLEEIPSSPPARSRWTRARHRRLPRGPWWIYGPSPRARPRALHVVSEAQRGWWHRGLHRRRARAGPIYARNLGVNTDELLISQPDTASRRWRSPRRWCLERRVRMSSSSTRSPPWCRARSSTATWRFAARLQAAPHVPGPANLTAAISRSWAPSGLHQPDREKIGVMFGAPETTSGRRAEVYASIRLDIRRQDPSERYGVDRRAHKVKVVKNKLAPPFREAEVRRPLRRGHLQVGTILDAVEQSLVEKSGTCTRSRRAESAGTENARMAAGEPVALAHLEARCGCAWAAAAVLAEVVAPSERRGGPRRQGRPARRGDLLARRA